MKYKYLDNFPKPLLDDLIRMKWLPVVGAGLSLNASTPRGREIPLWNDLGKSVAFEMDDYPYVSPIDAISAYEHEFGRPKLVELLVSLMLLEDATPGVVHEAFCAIPFDIVCTTNLDLLLEKQYHIDTRYCRPLIDEDHLSVNSDQPSLSLLKLHGDLHHPSRMVVTESDYDGFLSNYPLLSTYLSNLLITRTAVLIGYSLDDPDFRQIWHVVKERLGKSRRLAYTIQVDASASSISRFDRRGVRVINLPGKRSNYGDILATAFNELAHYIKENILKESFVTEEAPLYELVLPSDSVSRLCFFAVPLELESIYKDHVFPFVRQNGFVPITATDVISPGDSVVAKIDALIDRASLVIVDVATPATLTEFLQVLSKYPSKPMLTITTDAELLPSRYRDTLKIIRPRDVSKEIKPFVSEINSWLEAEAKIVSPKVEEEPLRLLNTKEYRAAVVSSVTLLESWLNDKLYVSNKPSPRPIPIRQLMMMAFDQGLISEVYLDKIPSWLQTRNSAVHSNSPVSAKDAKQIVNGVLSITKQNSD